jgi:hypothetical protein
MLLMPQEEEQRLYELVQNPPPGSTIEAAKAYGVDLTLILRRLKLTPTERVLEMEQAMQLVEEMRKNLQPTE